MSRPSESFPPGRDAHRARCAAEASTFRKALKAAKLDVTHRIHDLRHTFGTRMAAVGTPMRTLQDWMKHRDIATTQRSPTTRRVPARQS